MPSSTPARLASAALQGIKAIEVTIEVNVLAGLPSFTVVGLGDTAIKESKERLTAALSYLGYTPPRRKTIVSLAPASLKKEGSQYDLPITLGYLQASGQINVPVEQFTNSWFLGELSLDGSIRPARGILPVVLAAISTGIKTLYIPANNAQEAAAAADRLTIIPIASLPELITHLTAAKKDEAARIKPLRKSRPPKHTQPPDIDFADIKGQEGAKRSLILAAAGGHNVLMAGPPGTGKTLLARALAGILPPLTTQQAYEVTSLYSIAGLLNPNQGLVTKRPFRSPHHGASSVALVGGGTNPRPGEVSLAHHGVLFLDELPEFAKHVLDQLRQPIEDGIVTVSRSSSTLQFPARSILVGAMNPCKCGYLGSQQKECQCAPGDVLRYQRRVSGPLLDRFDIHVMVNDVPVNELLSAGTAGQSSAELSERTSAVLVKQLKRQGKSNAQLSVREIKRHCQINNVAENLLTRAQESFHLSARGVHRLLKVSRTIADFDDQPNIESSHVAEALQYREQLKSALPDFV